MEAKHIEILDTTLRDGAQGEDITFSLSDKLAVIHALDAFGVSYIEAGSPCSNPKDAELFAILRTVRLKQATLCAFGSTLRKGKTPETDENFTALLGADTPVVILFGKAWDLHVSEILQVTPEENLELIRQSVSYFTERGKDVFFDAEHFFDGYRANPAYALEVLQTAQQAGAVRLCLCDTNGGTLPGTLFRIVREVCGNFTLPIGIHTHNDSGCAAANSLLALEAGVTHIQGTMIGLGERCGNADLSSIIPAIQLKTPYSCDGKLSALQETANKIAEIANTQIPANRPYIGSAAFSHKAGMHIDGVIKNPASFEHINPEEVGNRRKFLISEVAGRNSVLQRVRQFEPRLSKDSPELLAIVEQMKELERCGYQFEAADASFELLAKRILGQYRPHFSLIYYKAMDEYPAPEREQQATAMIKISVDGKTELAAAMGKGPVNALDGALRKALEVFYPCLAEIKLTDYKVRVLEQEAATAAKVRVLIETADAGSSWSTVGVSDDIIQASLTALIDAVEYKLSKTE